MFRSRKIYSIFIENSETRGQTLIKLSAIQVNAMYQGGGGGGGGLRHDNLSFKRKGGGGLRHDNLSFKRK